MIEGFRDSEASVDVVMSKEIASDIPGGKQNTEMFELN
jgi:hypothetical protein